MRKTGYILAVTVVAAALCADRMAAAPVMRPQIAQAARQLAGKLTFSFREIVPAVRLHEVRRDEAPAVQTIAAPIFPPLVRPHPVESTPFQFRLPPPAAA